MVISQTNTLEECYEYMLSFAARGLPGEAGSQRDLEVREQLQNAVDALRSLGPSCSAQIAQDKLEPVDKYEAFFKVLAEDADKAAVAIDLVLIQPSISSQLIDNLNASMHLRALLTDLFLVTEALKPQSVPAIAN